MIAKPKLDAIDWEAAGAELDAHGRVRLASALEVQEARTGDASRAAAFAEALGAELYSHLRPIADRWTALLSEAPFPRRAVTRATVDMQRAGEGRSVGRDGGQAPRPFPLRATLLLSEPGQDFTGGEIVTIEQRPRMQSRPTVIVPHRGDLVIFAAGTRPVHGANGLYRTRTKHAVSRVRTGERVALEIVFV